MFVVFYCTDQAKRVYSLTWFKHHPDYLTLHPVCKFIFIFSVTFELEPGAVGHTTDFKEANKRLEWGLKKVILIIRFFPLIISIFFNTDLWMFIKNPSVGYFRLIRVILIDNNNGCSILLQVGGGSEHTLRAKLTFSRSYMVHC